MQMRAGRNFSRSYTTDDTAAYVLNETAVKLLGWQRPEQAVGQPFAYGDRHLNRKIIGVVKDFHFESLHQPIVPLVLYISPDWLRNVSVRLSGQNVREAVAHAEGVWKQFRPEEPFQYQFLDENFARLYQDEETRGQLFTLFTGVAILVACLGLFGLATYATSQRSKEIGIRKVLGASLTGIVALLSKEFIRLVGIAFLLAAPLAYYLVQRWLEAYPYRVSLSWPLFALAGAVTLLIALVTVGFQAFKAAAANPVKSLRSE
jgi:putative ABC transport system permease protein